MKRLELNARQDILVETNRSVLEIMDREVKKLQGPDKIKNVNRTDARFQIRKTLIEKTKSDPNGFERIIGESQLLSVNFLSRGIKAAKAVCRIRVPTQGGEWFGTGFLVGPRLLLTNHHVIANYKEASQCEAEFEYEHDEDGVLKAPIQFNLDPSNIFYTDKDHDITFVGVAAYSDAGIPLDRFRFLPLIPLSGKGLEGEWVTIIQHPGGLPKQMTIRASQIIELDQNVVGNLSDKVIHYSTDTDPGSSGAPVLNDQWQVVAIHHKAIPDPAYASNLSDDANIKWIANEGIRISAIFNLLEKNRFSNLNVSKVLEQLSRSLGLQPVHLWQPIDSQPSTYQEQRKALSIDYWTQLQLGYDPDFLSLSLPLVDMLGTRANDAAVLKDGASAILDYLHFSAVVDRGRKFAMLTAVNIYGAKLINPSERSDSWRRDSRLDDKFQPADNFYVKSRGNDPVSFSRGHLVRRLDPCWGTKKEAEMAEMHTFHFANAAPQVQRYNNVEWGDLEDYILNQTQTLERKVTVLTGPIFKPNAPTYGAQREGGPWLIPVSYWKIAIIEKPNNNIAAAAFIVGQVEYVQALFEARVFTSLSPYTYEELETRRIQTTIQTIEEETGLDFSMLRNFDAHNALESTRQTRFLRHNGDILI